MILKIYNEGNGEWVYIDHIAEIRKNDYGVFKLQTYKGKGDACLEGFEGQLVPVKKEGEDRRYFPDRSFYRHSSVEGDGVTVVTVTYEKNKEEGIAFTGDAYLLNDDGKTIERI